MLQQTRLPGPPSRTDEYGRNYAGQRGGQDLWQNTPESFKAMSEAAGFSGMPGVYSGMVDSQDMIGGNITGPNGEYLGPTDPITGKPYSGGSVGLQARSKLADYFENNPGSREWWESNFAEPTTEFSSATPSITNFLSSETKPNPYSQMETAPGPYDPAYSGQGMELAGYVSPWEKLGPQAEKFYQGLYSQYGEGVSDPMAVEDVYDDQGNLVSYGQVAGLDPYQTKALEAAETYTGEGGRGTKIADAVYDQLGEGVDMDYVKGIADNPYMDSMINSALRDPYRQFTEQTMPGIDLASSTIGGPSSRTELAKGVAERGYADRASDVAANMRGSAYQTGLQMGENKVIQDQNLANLSNQLGLQNINTLNQAGGQFQNQAQLVRNAAQGNWAYQQDRPWELAQNLNALTFQPLSGFGARYGQGAPSVTDTLVGGLVGGISGGIGSGFQNLLGDWIGGWGK